PDETFETMYQKLLGCHLAIAVSAFLRCSDQWCPWYPTNKGSNIVRWIELHPTTFQPLIYRTEDFTRIRRTIWHYLPGPITRIDPQQRFIGRDKVNQLRQIILFNHSFGG